jgi:hypothetical protein
MKRWKIPRNRRPRSLNEHAAVFLSDVFEGTASGLFFMLGASYKLLASWWLDPLMDGWAVKQFVKEIRDTMPFLFEIYGAALMPSPRPQSDGKSEIVVYLRADCLLFRFAKWHDELLEVRVASSSGPNDTYNLNELLSLLGAKDQIVEGDYSHSSLLRYRWLLEPRFTLLAAALSDNNIEQTRRKITAFRRGF